MLVSLKWLRDYVDCSLPPRELADALTMAGLEVESVAPGGPDFSGVVVARITAIEPHPDADNLSLCHVEAGDRNVRVVCGASNMKVGDAVPLAQVGATIPGGYTIRHTKIRGEASEGMLCSEAELDIGDDETGIMILDPDLPPGMDLKEALDLEDTVMDIAVTPNRPDCLSIIGIAREVAAVTGARLRHPDSSCRESGEDISRATSVEIQSPELCPRYTARLIRNITVKPSPAWMRNRLEAVGLRAINNIVDVTNYVMMEMGQPLHAFDFSFLEEGRIIVRGAAEGEVFLSLDEKSRVLKKDTLMICDGVKPVAIAGIMGGLNSEVRDETETILLESAYFNPVSIRKTARTLGMSTDASFRFERGIDPEGVVRALDRAARLLADLSDGVVVRGRIDEYPRPVAPPGAIRLRTERTTALLGTAIDQSRIEAVLKGLEMTVRPNGTGECIVTPPSFRGDLTREADLIEEVARIIGYEEIPLTIPALAPPSENEATGPDGAVDDVIKTVLTGLGYSEVIHYSFTSPDSTRLLGYPEGHESRRFVTIANPLTEDGSVLRTTLVFGLLEAMRKNIHAGTTDLKFFEQGRIFIKTGAGALPLEQERIAGLLTGSRYGKSWHFKDVPADFYDIKGCLETLFDALGIEGIRFVPDPTIPHLNPGRAATVFFREQQAGYVGEIHPDVCDRLDLSQTAFVFEMDRNLLAAAAVSARRFRDIPRYPAINRDVAFLAPRDLTADALCAPGRTDKEELLESVEVFDVYSGPSIPHGMKSLALRFTYRSQARTLADQEVNEVHRRIVEEIMDKTGATIRGMD